MNNTIKPNQSTAKVLKIIEAMAELCYPVRIKELREKLNMPGATLIRFLHTLINEGYVRHEAETGRYFLTLKISQIGEQVNSRFNLREIIHPYLVHLMQRSEESTCLAIDIDQKVIYIDAVEGPSRVLRTLQRIGKSAPLHSTGVGKNLLLNYSADEISGHISRNGLERLTEKTIVTGSELFKELEKVKKEGYAVDDEECELGVRCIAAPIRDFHNKIVASISVSGPSSRIKSDHFTFIKEEVTQTAKNISSILNAY